MKIQISEKVKVVTRRESLTDGVFVVTRADVCGAFGRKSGELSCGCSICEINNCVTVTFKFHKDGSATVGCSELDVKVVEKLRKWAGA